MASSPCTVLSYTVSTTYNARGFLVSKRGSRGSFLPGVPEFLGNGAPTLTIPVTTPRTAPEDCFGLVNAKLREIKGGMQDLANAYGRQIIRGIPREAAPYVPVLAPGSQNSYSKPITVNFTYSASFYLTLVKDCNGTCTQAILSDFNPTNTGSGAVLGRDWNPEAD
jgi:hypothetical protein